MNWLHWCYTQFCAFGHWYTEWAWWLLAWAWWGFTWTARAVTAGCFLRWWYRDVTA